MAIVKNLPDVEREVPHEPGCAFTFRRLSGREMDEAQAAAVKETIERYGAQTMEALTRAALPQATGANAPADPLSGYSEDALVRLGVSGWRGGEYDGVECSAENKSELDAETRRWAAKTVLEINHISEGEAEGSARFSARNGTLAESTISA